jgi:hypothetical protein
MANFILSYDLNGPAPSHRQVDEHLAKLPAKRARILETVWYVAFDGDAGSLHAYLRRILSPNDQSIVVEAKEAAWRNLLVRDDALLSTWEQSRYGHAA